MSPMEVVVEGAGQKKSKRFLAGCEPLKSSIQVCDHYQKGQGTKNKKQFTSV
jgi:hypothetical protein